MKSSKLSGLLFLVALVVIAGSGCDSMTTVRGIAHNGGGIPIDTGAKISLNCSGINFRSAVVDDGAFSILVPLVETDCAFNDLRYTDQYGGTEIYECVSHNCSFSITETDTVIDLWIVYFSFQCIEVRSCLNYCIDRGLCPGGSECTQCQEDCSRDSCN